VGYVFFDIVDETHQFDFTALMISLTRSNGRPYKRLAENFTVSVSDRW